jgi:anthranilate synthase component 2
LQKLFKMKILVLDNYDSFTYNLVHYLEAIGNIEVSVYRNDKIAIEEINNFDKIVLSPGPGLPKDAGIMPQLIKTYAGKKPILGVCLGHQAIAEAFGGSIYNLEKVYHGISTNHIILTDHYLFDGLPKQFKVGRYHSWNVKLDLPDNLKLISTDENGLVMAMCHKTFDITGVQFHPESVLTEYGKEIILNWVKH